MSKLKLLILAITLLTLPAAALALQKGEAFPAFVGTTLEGQQFDLSEVKGEPVLIKIGTTWCGTCQKQSQAIGELHDFISANNIHFVDVYIQENAKKVRKYLDNKGLKPETVILDDGELAKKLNVYLIPRVILLDREHKVYRDGDPLSTNELKEKLQALIASKES